MDSVAVNIFIQAAESRSFIAAGRAVGISSSGVGKSVTRLEKSLGVRLFHRSTRSVTLTAEGEMFLKRARRIMEEIEAARSELFQTAATPKGRLRIGLPMVGDPFLPVLAAFQREYPAIGLDLEFDNRRVDVIEEGFDVVIRSGEIEDSRLTSRHLGKFRMMLVGSPEYFSRFGRPQYPRDLSSHACIQFRISSSGKLQSWKLRRHADDAEYHLSTKMTCNTNEARLYFALEGLGIAYLSEFSAREALDSGKLETVLDDFIDEKNNFRMLWPSGRHISPKVRVFIEFMSAYVPIKRGNGGGDQV